MLSKLKSKLSSFKEEVVVLETENKVTRTNIKELEDENKILTCRIELSVAAVQLVEKVAYNRRSTVKLKLEGLVTDCIKTVFGDNYSIDLEYAIKNNRTSVQILAEKTIKEGVVRRKVTEGFGGGVSDVVSLPLKLLVLMANPKVSKVLFADECGKHIDEIRIERFASFLNQISKKLPVQIILCTHHQQIDTYADRVYSIFNDGNKSQITKVK